MIRMNVSAGVAALAVSLLSVLIGADTGAQAQQSAAPVEHTQPAADEVVPQFVAKPLVQALPETASPEPQPRVAAASLSALVGDMQDQEAALDEQMRCLAGAIYFEARGEPLAGQLAVAEVVVNRAASGKFPASYCGVVTQRSQFSFVKRGRMPTAPAHSLAWKRAKAIAQIAHRGLWDSQAEGSLYFHARHVAPSWSNRRQAMARISNHVFYK